MDILPTLRIGIWNAWILMLFFPLQPLIIRGIEMATGAGFIMKRMGDQPTNPRERDLNLAYLAIEGLLILYSIFLPLRLGTFWIYVGVSLYLLGLLIFLGVCFSVDKTLKINRLLLVCIDSRDIGVPFPVDYLSGGSGSSSFLDIPDSYNHSLGADGIVCR